MKVYDKNAIESYLFDCILISIIPTTIFMLYNLIREIISVFMLFGADYRLWSSAPMMHAGNPEIITLGAITSIILLLASMVSVYVVTRHVKCRPMACLLMTVTLGAIPFALFLFLLSSPIVCLSPVYSRIRSRISPIFDRVYALLYGVFARAGMLDFSLPVMFMELGGFWPSSASIMVDSMLNRDFIFTSVPHMFTRLERCANINESDIQRLLSSSDVYVVYRAERMLKKRTRDVLYADSKDEYSAL